MALALSHYRFGIDELAESTHGWRAAEDANPAQGVILVDVTFLLRFTVQADATGLSNVDNEFQYRKNGGPWTNITTSSTNVVAIAATALTNGGNCTKRLSGTGTFESSGAGQTEDGTSGGTANDIVASGNSETECGLQLVGASLADDDVIEFRLTRDGGALLDTYAVVPSVIVLKDMAGTLSATLGALTLVSTGVLDITGSATMTLDALTMVSTGAVEIAGTCAAALDDASLVATGVLTDPEIVGMLDVTLAPVTAQATGALDVAGSLAVTLDDVVCAGTGTLDIAGQASAILDPLTIVASAISVSGLRAWVYLTPPEASEVVDAIDLELGVNENVRLPTGEVVSVPRKTWALPRTLANGDSVGPYKPRILSICGVGGVPVYDLTRIVEEAEW